MRSTRFFMLVLAVIWLAWLAYVIKIDPLVSRPDGSTNELYWDRQLLFWLVSMIFFLPVGLVYGVWELVVWRAKKTS